MDESKEVPSPLELHKMMDWRDELLIRLGHPCIFENGMFVPDPNWDPYAGFSPKLQSKYLFVDRTNFHNVDINDFLGLNRVCARNIDIVHPRNGGFTCGSQDGLKVFLHSIPGLLNHVILRKINQPYLKVVEPCYPQEGRKINQSHLKLSLN
uniref:Uncharacterized protein n=1 Tax=Oryza brachyantha TaxID=4533 RepID=J3LC55_ORYBR